MKHTVKRNVLLYLPLLVTSCNTTHAPTYSVINSQTRTGIAGKIENYPGGFGGLEILTDDGQLMAGTNVNENGSFGFTLPTTVEFDHGNSPKPINQYLGVSCASSINVDNTSAKYLVGLLRETNASTKPSGQPFSVREEGPPTINSDGTITPSSEQIKNVYATAPVNVTGNCAGHSVDIHLATGWNAVSVNVSGAGADRTAKLNLSYSFYLYPF